MLPSIRALLLRPATHYVRRAMLYTPPGNADAIKSNDTDEKTTIVNLQVEIKKPSCWTASIPLARDSSTSDSEYVGRYLKSWVDMRRIQQTGETAAAGMFAVTAISAYPLASLLTVAAIPALPAVTLALSLGGMMASTLILHRAPDRYIWAPLCDVAAGSLMLASSCAMLNVPIFPFAAVCTALGAASIVLWRYRGHSLRRLLQSQVDAAVIERLMHPAWFHSPTMARMRVLDRYKDIYPHQVAFVTGLVFYIPVCYVAGSYEASHVVLGSTIALGWLSLRVGYFTPFVSGENVSLGPVASNSYWLIMAIATVGCALVFTSYRVRETVETVVASDDPKHPGKPGKHYEFEWVKRRRVSKSEAPTEAVDAYLAHTSDVVVK